MVVAVVGVVLATVGSTLAATMRPARATGVTPQIAGSPAAPTASEISPVCTAPDGTPNLGPEPTLPADPVHALVTPPGGLVNFTATADGVYVDTGASLAVYSLSGTEERSFALPSVFPDRDGNEISAPVVDPEGNIYLASYYDQVVDKFSPTGQLLWSVDPSQGNPTGLFGVGTGAGFELMVSVVQDSSASQRLDLATGAETGTFPYVDDLGFVTQESDGDLLVTGDGYVRTLAADGSVLSTFGSSKIEGQGAHTGGGYQIYYPAQAVQGPDGTLYTADPLHTLESTGPQGYLEGTTTLGGDLTFGADNLYLVGSTVYLEGSGNVSSVPLATLQAYLGTVQAPDDTLGWGAGLDSSAAGNYFAPGTTPSVAATFDPWWAAEASHLELAYSIEDTDSLTAETVPAPTDVDLPTSAGGLASIPLTLPVADQQPGPYLVQASLFDTSTSPPTRLGTTCMPYTVGAPGDGLDLADLPAGMGAGGPDDPRGVALNAQLGLDGLRGATIDWSTYLPHCSASAPTAATCGPSAMTFAGADDDYFKAAYLAARDHVTYWLQASGGSQGSVPSALVSDGWWGADVTALVRFYATVPAGCGASCAPVTMWEPWNEPNNTGYGDAATYVSEVLAPFYRAVKTVLPGSSSTVIGGSSLSVSLDWWSQLIASGGLADMDAASVHPYTGNNDSFEEDGTAGQVEQLEAMLGSTPLWFTEVGWWSDGDYNYLNQANIVARAMIWEKVLHIPVWNYYFDEGNWGNGGISFSLIQLSTGDDYVKPAALATMATAGQIAGRPYRSMPPTGIPQTYRADFGPSTAAGATATSLSAVWSDGLSTNGTVSVTAPGGGSIPVTVTSEYGDATTVSVASGATYSLPISDQVTMLSYPEGDTLSLGPTEAYGPDLAAASDGGSAAASSGTASAAIAGLVTGYNQGWSSDQGDTAPTLTVTLAAPATVNRVVVDTQSVGSTATGLRDYTVAVDEPGAGWTTVATVAGQYRAHEEQVVFDPVTATGVRIAVSEINFGGYYGGGIPPWWPSSDNGVAFVHALQVYGGSDLPPQVAGTGLAPLATEAPGSPIVPTPPAPPSPGSSPSTGTTTTTVPTVPTTPTTPTTTPTVVAPPAAGGQGDTTHTPLSDGYRLATRTGAVEGFGTEASPGSAGSDHLNQPIVGMAATPDGRGYWLVASDGGIFSFGDTSFHGSTGALHLNRPIVGMAATPDGGGYWLVASDGGVFAFGDASFHGSTGALRLNQPIVGMAATPDGRGYWLVASDGGIFAFGDASFHGSTGALRLNRPIVGMAATANGGGYWLVASDGGIFAFGDASFHGSTGAIHLDQPIVGMAATPDGGGYWLVASDGGVFALGDAPFRGSAGGGALGGPAVAIT